MLSKLFFAAVYLVGLTAVSAGVQSPKPACVDKCWENTQYVSSCVGSTQCLCDDADFQNTVYQCLYTQCHTAQFGSALHHTLAMCSNHEAPEENATHHTAPALIRQEGRKQKRQYPMQSVSVSVSVRPTGRPMSVSASAYRGSPTARGSPTRSAGGSPTGRPRGSPTASVHYHGWRRN